MVLNAVQQALRLTRAGRLDEAVGLIQSRLAGSRQPPRATKDAVIDLTPVPQTTAAGLIGHAALEQPLAPAVPAQFLNFRHDGAAGALDYCLYAPANPVPGLPLIVMLHGCTQSPEDFARGTGMNRLAEQARAIVAYPRQSQAANPQKCWNWFRPVDQQRDSGEAALIAGTVRDIIASHHVDPTRIYLAGLSAGGAAAANIAACYPELFAAVAIHSGLVHGAAHGLPAALSAMRQGSRNAPDVTASFVPTITFHGERDTTVHPVNSDQIVAAAASTCGTPLTTSIVEGGKVGGRRYTRTVSRDTTGKIMIEQWTIAGAGHAWSGGDSAGSYTDPAGPDASQEMLRFFLQHRRA